MFVQTVIIGRVTYPPQVRRTVWNVDRGGVVSYAWFCPYCADIWARAIVTTAPVFQSNAHPCEKHLLPDGWLFQLPGSIFLSWDKDFTAALPRELWEREFNLHYKLITEGARDYGWQKQYD